MRMLSFYSDINILHIKLYFLILRIYCFTYYIKIMKKYLFWLILWSILLVAWFWTWVSAAKLTATELTNKIIQTADANTYPKESLVQWYYSVEDLYTRLYTLAPLNEELARLSLTKDNLRKEINRRKDAIATTWEDNLLIQYQNSLDTMPWLSNLCKNNYELADDWAYALNLPTSLVLATWDIEASCGLYKPSNRNGVFQLTVKDYGVGENLTKWEWIMMMYDYAELVKGKVTRYHTANKLSSSNCSTKDLVATGQTAPICLSYGSLDFDSIIKYGALYNWLSWSTIKWDIRPGAPDYVFGKFGPDNQTAKKDGLMMRILKILDYNKKR